MTYKDLLVAIQNEDCRFIECNVEDMQKISFELRREHAELQLPGILQIIETQHGLSVKLERW